MSRDLAGNGSGEGGGPNGWEVGDFCRYPGRQTRILGPGGWFEMPTDIDYRCIQIERGHKIAEARIQAFALACRGNADPMKPIRDTEREYGRFKP